MLQEKPKGAPELLAAEESSTATAAKDHEHSYPEAETLVGLAQAQALLTEMFDEMALAHLMQGASFASADDQWDAKELQAYLKSQLMQQYDKLNNITDPQLRAALKTQLAEMMQVYSSKHAHLHEPDSASTDTTN
eukprot:scaffold1839_cov382-Prasinococcus_capsulatus_cf.AAC.39